MALDHLAHRARAAEDLELQRPERCRHAQPRVAAARKPACGIAEREGEEREGRGERRFVAWGRKVPRTGGMVFAVGTRDEIEAEAQRDPFVANGAATVNVIEFDAKFAGEGLEALQR